MNYNKCTQCPRGPHKIIKMAEDSPHKYKKVCAACERHIQWVSYGQVNYEEMVKSIDLMKLNPKELDFITTSVKNYMYRGWTLSEKQITWLDIIIRKYSD